MARKKKPLLEKDYTYNKERKKYKPLLEVWVGTQTSKKKVIALVDTGCTTCVHLCKAYVEKMKLVFIKKMNRESLPFGVADGHTINGDKYKAICQINGEEKEIEVSVIDPEKFFREEEQPQIKMVEPLLGRDLLDQYDVLFQGEKKKLIVYKPE